MNRFRSKARAAQALAVAMALLLLVLPACGGAPAALSASISAPDAASALQVSQAVTITGKASGSGMKAVDVYVDGVKFATVDKPAQNNDFVISVPWTPDKVGAHVIQLKGLNDKGEVLVASDAVFVTVQASAAAAAQTQATAAPTAAPATATVAITPTVSQPAATATPQGPTASVKEGDFVNVRKGPAIAYDKVGTLDRGQTAAIRGKNSDGTWWQITFPAGPDGLGWVFGNLVTVVGDTSQLAVASAPPLPKAVPTDASAATAVAPTAVPAPTSSLPPSALLPYSQVMRFSPRDTIGDVPLGYQGEGKTTSLVWEVNGAKSLELEITAVAGSGIFAQCPAGNLSTITPNDAAGKRIPLTVPSGQYQVNIDGKGYYLFTIYVVRADGSTTTIPRNVIVDCYKTQ
ncbi:MAG: SH3 domain-containing protein [Chloroflexi bacterium]|nr:SH3 domain-containing protein [Chloroflexota bacterium]MCL5274630.1 SH3 domain-containing protein [Chloroflexota bacterium]